jgi:NAD-dependent DNA ligase
LSDSEYDILKEYVERKYPDSSIKGVIGAPAQAAAKSKVVLPFHMPSMDKIKPDTNALAQWKQKYTGPYVCSCKLDGVSAMVYSSGKNGVRLFTRGDGTVGQDISSLLSVLSIPKLSGDWAIRGELILPKKTFEEKYKKNFANPRNLVSGMVNSKTIDSKMSDLHFVAYEIMNPPMSPSQQLSKLREMGFETVKNLTTAALSNESLSELLLDWRKNYEYEIDGVIVCNDRVYPRLQGNPDHAFAFKMVITDQQAEAKVVDVIWTPSKNGYLKPRVRIEPVRLSGATIEYTTGFNAKFIEDNRIGVGAIIQIIRSGDVIPYIQSVIVPADHTKMPNIPYQWNETHVDIFIENISEDQTVREKNIAGFFTKLEVDGLSIGNVKRLFEAGFDTVPKILRMTPPDFEKVEGFKKKMTEKVYTSIQKQVEKASLQDIMVASNKIGKGLGEKKIKLIMDHFPDILTSTVSLDEKYRRLQTCKGIGEENAKEFVSNIENFLGFLRECRLESKLHQNTVIPSSAPRPSSKQSISRSVKEHPLYQKKIVMTKVRDTEIIQSLSKFLATLEDKVNKETFALIVKSKEDKSNKTRDAEKYGVAIFTPEEFKQKYLQ